jgi:hypothetical protein
MDQEGVQHSSGEPILTKTGFLAQQPADLGSMGAKAVTSVTNRRSMQWYAEEIALQFRLGEDVCRGIGPRRDGIMLDLFGAR